MRLILSCALAALTVGFIQSADDKKVEKIDATKLLGKWEPKQKRFKGIEFLKDGKLSMTIPGAGMDFKLDGTYKVEGNKLITVVKTANAETKETLTVSKFTDTEITGVDDKGQELTLTRIKEK